jgi:hypothetical protein
MHFGQEVVRLGTGWLHTETTPNVEELNRLYRALLSILKAVRHS